jgi:hypothetical protein
MAYLLPVKRRPFKSDLRRPPGARVAAGPGLGVGANLNGTCSLSRRANNGSRRPQGQAGVAYFKTRLLVEGRVTRAGQPETQSSSWPGTRRRTRALANYGLRDSIRLGCHVTSNSLSRMILNSDSHRDLS